MNKMRMNNNVYVIAVLLPLFLSGCFSPWPGEQDKTGNGWVLVGKDTRAKTAVPGPKELDSMTYRITLTGPRGTVERELRNGGGAIELAAGDWEYSVTAWNSDPRLRGFAGGTLRVTPGGHSTVTLKSAVGIKNADELHDIFNNDSKLYNTYVEKEGGATVLVLEQDITLTKAIIFTGSGRFFLVAEPGRSRTIKQKEWAIDIPQGILLALGNDKTLPGATGLLTIEGNGSFHVAALGELIIGDGVVMQNYNIIEGIVENSGGTVTMNGGEIRNFASVSGAVYVKSGMFTMNGGTISTYFSESTTAVQVEEDGTFTMNGGSISNGHTQGGSPVVVQSKGTFIMSGGTINGNSSFNNSGGVSVRAGGKFTMNGGTIGGNFSGSVGGGVYVEIDGTFVKTGGTIYGKDEGINSNTANKGSAVAYLYAHDGQTYNSSYYYRETTAGPENKIDTTDTVKDLPLGFESKEVGS